MIILLVIQHTLYIKAMLYVYIISLAYVVVTSNQYLSIAKNEKCNYTTLNNLAALCNEHGDESCNSIVIGRLIMCVNINFWPHF